MQNKHNSSSKLATLWLVIVVFFSALLFKQLALSVSLPIETNILKLLPKNQQNPTAEKAFEQVADSMSNKVIFVLSSDNNNTKSLFNATKAFEHQLRQLDLFASISGNIDQSKQAEWAQFYHQHRFQLLTEQQQKTLNESPESQVTNVLQALYNPFSGVTNAELTSDPFLLFREYLTELTSLSGNFSLKDGYLSTESEGKTHLLVSADLKESPYSLNTQNLLPQLTTIEETISQQYAVSLIHTGVLFYAEYGSQSAKSEISTIGLGSLVGIIILVLFVFRSPLPLALSLLSISTGLLVALASTIAIFGQVHLFSLVFGASLIGVSIDYSFHFLTDRLAAGSKWKSWQALKHILTAITLGLLTSLIGYLGLLIAPFPGLQQLALFSAIGLIAAYASVVCWYPILAVSASGNITLPGYAIWRWWLNCWTKPAISNGLPISIFCFSLIGLTQVNYNDDIRQLQAMPDALKTQEETISKLSGVSNSQEMLLVTDSTRQGLLEKLSQLSKPLEQLKAQRVISGYQSLSQYLPTLNQQAANYQLVKTLYAQQAKPLASRLSFNKVPEISDFSPISISDFLASPVSEPLRFMWLKPINGQFASVILLKGVSQTSVIKSWVKSADIQYLNKADEISDLFADYRIKIAELLIVVLVTIWGLLTWRYGLLHSFKIILPSLIAGVAGLAVTSLTGSTINLFNLLALILILGIGIDYTLFFAEKQKSESTLLAISLSGATTLLSFGLLALSQTHAIHSFGITVLTGIFVAWLLSPIAINPNTAKLKKTTSRHLE